MFPQPRFRGVCMIAGGKGVFRSQFGEVPTQHSLRVRRRPRRTLDCPCRFVDKHTYSGPFATYRSTGVRRLIGCLAGGAENPSKSLYVSG